MLRTHLPLIFACCFTVVPANAESPLKELAQVAAEPEIQGARTSKMQPGPVQVSGSITGTDPFCESIVEPARERRYYLKLKELETLLDTVNTRIEELDKRALEHKEWLRRREEFAKRASENLVQIYSAMKPEASAARLSELDQGLAASLLLAIAPRQASAILNEMDEKAAAVLTGIMSASARVKDPS